jgi:hypothetical protein
MSKTAKIADFDEAIPCSRELGKPAKIADSPNENNSQLLSPNGTHTQEGFRKIAKIVKIHHPPHSTKHPHPLCKSAIFAGSHIANNSQ